MRGKWLVIIMVALATTLLFNPACKTKKNVEDSDSRTVTVTMLNTGAVEVHIYVEGQTPNDNNLVQPGGTQTTQFIAKKVGHNITFYVQQAGTVLATIICTVGQTAWDSQQSVVEWNGQALLCVTW
jgi:cytochrome c-type biogenesis protein CcmH/NrfG